MLHPYVTILSQIVDMLNMVDSFAISHGLREANNNCVDLLTKEGVWTGIH